MTVPLSSPSARFKDRLHRRDMQFGFFIGLPSPALVEMIGWAGFDFVIIDTEHGPMSLETVEHMLRAAEGAGMAALVRVPGAGAAHILPVLDIGASGILVPHVSSVEVARDVVAEAYYPPLGRRGISTVSRGARYGLGDGAAYLAKRAQETSVVLMIEDAATLPLVGEIAALPGVDAIFIGPNDLAASLGHAGQPNHPDVQAAIAGIRAAVLPRDGVALASIGGRAPGDAEKQRQAGISMVCFSTPLLIANALKDLMKQVRPTGPNAA
jgi:4-hydroxy-2-oxoheptanedioate aldolase